MSDREKKISVTLFVLAIVFTIMGSTLAYWSWQTSTNDQTNVTFRVTSDFSCGVDGGGNITSQQKSLAPTTCTDENYALQRPIVVKPTITANGKTIYMDLNLKVNQIGEYLAQSSNFKYALTTDSESCTNGVVASGTFQGATANTEIRLLHNKSYSSTTNDPYYLYIWLDAAETNNNTQNQTFDISLGGTCSSDVLPYNGTIYRFSDRDVSIGQRVEFQPNQAWCYGSSCDNGFSFETKPECEAYVADWEDVTCVEGTVQPISYETNASNLNKTVYLKHTIVDDIATESYVGFVVTPRMAGLISGMTAGTYYLKGGDNGAAYATNKATLTTAFGSSNCTDEDSYFWCSVVLGLDTETGVYDPSLKVSTDSDGTVFATVGEDYEDDEDFEQCVVENSHNLSGC